MLGSEPWANIERSQVPKEVKNSSMSPKRVLFRTKKWDWEKVNICPIARGEILTKSWWDCRVASAGKWQKPKQQGRWRQTQQSVRNELEVTLYTKGPILSVCGNGRFPGLDICHFQILTRGKTAIHFLYIWWRTLETWEGRKCNLLPPSKNTFLWQSLCFSQNCRSLLDLCFICIHMSFDS